MKIAYDRGNDSLYIDLVAEPSVESREISPGFVLDYGARGNIVGIDIDHASRRLDLREFVLREFPLDRPGPGHRSP